ncbi:SDR family NAD(P)-dependent oxidoreductase [Amycolatopsis sp. CA-161197]|uniref:SDR family NAD(P)-dependent oxidoreductase n=1 Tax=Amycolatopsis sp. CA-161197 TaxID=3239922 RepID=UPI003D8F6F7B
MDTRIALVTGGNRGFGRSAALALAGDGADVIITYRETVEEAHAVVKEIRALGREAGALRVDLSRAERFTEFDWELGELLGDVWGRTTFDHLVNNAGHGILTTLGTTALDDVQSLVDVHFTGVYFLTQQLAPRIADGGSIVNISSVLARSAGEGWSVYAAMKGAVEVLTRYHAQELGKRGIRVNVVAPGPAATDFLDGTIRDDAAVREMLGAQAALGRVAEADDIGPVIAAVLSDRFGWVTGQRIEASGGAAL